MDTVVGILKEATGNERRVAVVPDTVSRAKKSSLSFLLEQDAGSSAYFRDSMYEEYGAEILPSRNEVIERSQILAFVQKPSIEDVKLMKKGTVVVGTLDPRNSQGITKALADNSITAFSLDLLPRTSRAQAMDVLSSQSSVAGYHAALLAAELSPLLFPMLTTAAGTIRPSNVLVIGAGVAGLMAIATCRRLGARVAAFDVRRSAGEDVRSLGATFLETKIDASARSGYARELTKEEQEEQQKLLEGAISQADSVITTASVPGRKAPIVVSASMVESMKEGAVLVDLAADSGGNCELTVLSKTVEHKGVKIVGPPNMPSLVPKTSSMMYSRNILSFLELLTNSGKGIPAEFSDDILKATLVTSKGSILLSEPGKGGF